MGEDETPIEGTAAEIAPPTELEPTGVDDAAPADVETLTAILESAEAAASDLASALSDAELEAAAAAVAERDAGADDITGDEDEDTAATKLEAMRRGRAARAKVAELNARRLAETSKAADAAEAIARARADPTPDPDADDEAGGPAPEHPNDPPPETEIVAERAEDAPGGSEEGSEGDGSSGSPAKSAIPATAAERAAAEAAAADLEARVATAELEEVTFEGDDADAPATVKLGAVSRGERAPANLDELRAARAAAANAAAALAPEAPEEEEPAGPKEYVPEEMRRAPREDELHRSAVVMHHSFGFESTKRNNLHYLDDSTVIFTVGAMVQTLNLETLEQTYLYGIDGGGVGFVCVHPDKEHFVLGEKGTNPNVYVYERETLKLSKVLTGGTERAYSCGRFSPDGSMLATVGGYPDFWLTVWDWRNESIVLRSKAFSQDVFDVTFSPFFEGHLTTAGTGHLRFWKMAETFTGLKLQGDIGRFGNEDLSDIAGYAELPDGKVLSGTESGRMLLWDGALIKAVLVRANVDAAAGDDDSVGRPCHDGMIEFIKLDVDAGIFHTAGADGYVRTWDFAEVNDAEPGEDTSLVFIEPKEEFRILADAASDVATSVKSIITTEPDHWLVQDEAGGITKVALDESGRPGASRRLAGFHAGPINGLEVSRVSDHAVTVGQDGTVRVFAYVEKREVYAARFNAPATSLALAPARVDEESRVHVVGFEDGVVRVLLRCADRWKLLDCVKPHNKRVTCALYAPKGAFLATGSHDGKVFFFSVTGARGAGLEPVGFATAPGPVSAMDWNDVGDKILVGCESGEIFEMAVPAVGSVDSTRTFEFEPEATHYAFKRPRPTAESIVAARAPPPSLEEMTPEEAKAAEKKLADEVAELQAEMDEEERSAVYPVRHIAYELSGSFELAVGGEASGKIFTCALESPNPLTYVATHDATITTVRTSLSRKITVSAASDGTVRVARLGSARYWQGEVHDSQNGAVSGATTSRDDKFLLSASADGSFFVQRLGPELRGLDPDAVAEAGAETRASEGDEEEAEALVAPSAEEDESPEAKDILTSETYSIEDAKVKLEEDAKRAAAEEKQLGIRGYLDKLKEEYLALVAENDAKPPAERLPPDAFEIDPGLRDIVEAETQAKMELMHKSLAWETEKATLGLKKLNEWFLDDVEEERAVLRSFAEGRRGFAVTNFRVAKLSDALRRDIHLVHNPPKEEEVPELRRSRSVSMKSRPSKIMSEATEEPEEENPFATGHKQELRRQRRKAREAEWRAFNATKPDEQYENPEDVAAIEVARNTLGDFKLKSAPDYVVPEEESMNYRRKREQMLLLEEAIHDAKVDFNAEFAALRNVRARVVEQVQAACARIAEITVELDDADRPEGIEALTAVAEPFRSTPLADEYPKETRETVTDEQLAAFDAKRKAEAAAKAAKEAAKAGGGFGGGGAAKKEKTEEPTEADGEEEETDPIAAAVLAAAAAKDAAAHPREVAAAACAPTPLEVSEAEARALRYGHERARLVAIRRDVVRRFDVALKALRRRKSFVEGELKTAEMTKLTYNQELVQLQRFENGEKLLREKLVAKTEEREDLDAEMEEIANKVEDKEDELEGVVERKNKVLKEFESLVDESHAHREYLEKVFLRRIKRAKKKPAGEDLVEKDGESGSESDEESDDDEDYDSEDEEEEACPAECDPNLWDQVLALRERRQDQDDVINEINKINAEHKKESDALAKKAKTVGKTLAALEQEMFEFQKEKLETLNAVESTVTLRLRQVEYLYEGKIPNDLAEGIVFSRSVLDGLQRRIEELVGEKSALRKQQRDLRREHASLQKVKAERTEKNRELDASAVQMQMLKFGQLIDLEKLERAMIPKKGTEELKVMLKAQDAANREEKRKWNAELAKAQAELTAMTAQNTACLNAVADLTTRQRDLEARLMTTQQSVFVDPNAARRKEIAERDHLVAVVNAQAKEIDTLKAEIAVLSVKGRPQHMPFS